MYPMHRVLMITNHFYPSPGGLERQAQRLSKQLIHLGHKVEVLTPRYDSLPETEVVDNIPVTRFPILGQAHVRYGLKSKFKYAVSLIKHVYARRMEFDILHVHQALYAAFVSVIAGRLMRKKVIIKVAGSGIDGNMNILSKMFGSNFMLWVMKKADVFISLSPETTLELMDNGISGEKIVEIPNGIFIDDFTPRMSKSELRERYGVPIHHFVCVFTGRLSSVKNLDFLLSAWKIVCESQSEVLLLMAGDGPERGRLEALANELKISQNVRFLGYVSRVADILALSDCFVLTSTSGEGMSNSIIEAMTVGMPCIVSDIPANSNLITNYDSGILFDLKYKQSLANAILQVKSDSRLSDRLSLSARRKIVDSYSIEKIAVQYTEIYERLLEA